VNVALESGFKSLSLFNLLFVRPLWISPGKWRQKHYGDKNGKPVARQSAPENSQVSYPGSGFAGDCNGGFWPE